MDSDSNSTLCWRIISEIAQERGVDPTNVDERLYDVIDVESLTKLATQANHSDEIDLSVSFRLNGCFVTVTGDNTVRATCPN
ncbi:MAG: HalOD1 output domain-containing protein [Halobacteriota archaeon]|uniref:HalOD1 output domain-containing protein n=1 Tax=Natronomonas sp. TaxID=2184060 RepID=UPI003976E995